MARPRKEGMDYYPHDTDASSDEKIEAMRALFGNDGYAFYFILCERIYRTPEAELDISKPVLLAPIVSKLMVTKEKFQEMLYASFELGLFSCSDYESRGVLTSNGIKKRYQEVQRMRKKWRKIKSDDADGVDFPKENDVENYEFSTGKTPQETPESKEKQSKENKKEIYIATTAPIPDAFRFFEQNGFGFISQYIAEEIQTLIDEYSEPWVIKAMQEAVLSGKRTIKYVKGILERYKAEGVDEPWNVEKKKKVFSTTPKKPDMPVVEDNGPAREMSPEELEHLYELARKLKGA